MSCGMEKEDYEREVRKCVRQFWSQRKGALTKNKKESVKMREAVEEQPQGRISMVSRSF